MRVRITVHVYGVDWLVNLMDGSSHLSLIIDLSPSQWHLSAQPSNPHPLSFQIFLSHVLTFLNLHIASKHENTLAVFGALPGKRSALHNRATTPVANCNFSSMLYSSLDVRTGDSNDPPADANSYRPFKMVDSVVTNNIQKELDLIGGLAEECRLQAAPSQFALLSCLQRPLL